MLHPTRPVSFPEVARAVLERRRNPVATYRVQFGPSFTFADATRLVPYLAALGISDLYASPCLKPAHGSAHGYDVCDHNALNPALGTDEEFDQLAAELQRHGMGLIFDVVPNHMGIADPANSWWMDVLENGPSSPYACFFDIDWHPLKAEATSENKVLLPILSDPYGKALENGDLKLSYESGAFFVSYYDRRMPVTPRSYAEILSHRLAALEEALGADHPHLLELQSIITAIHYLPLETETEPDKVAERQREKEIVKRRIDTLVTTSSEIRQALEATVAEYNGTRGDPRSFDQLDALLDKQCYRLSFWRVAAEEINYRRFFDINDLAAIHMERPEVFAETHRLVLRLVRDGKVTGLRIDHADGLWDPLGYLRRLQAAAFVALAGPWLDRRVGDDPAERAAAERWLAEAYAAARDEEPCGFLGRPLYVVVEKILGLRETLQDTWPVDGTTGYDFANAVDGVFVNTANRKAFTDLYAAFTRKPPIHYGDLVNSMKKIIMLVSLASEINELGYGLKRIAWQNRWYRDFTLNSLTHAIREVIAAFPIYRTYLAADQGPIQPHDLAAIEAAVAEAKRRNPRTAAAVFDFVRRVLLQQLPESATAADRAEWSAFALRFQQTTGPVAAKGIEDTAFYVYNRLLSLNEVGGDPERFGLTPAEFHRQNLERRERWPYAMLAGSTHDSKRSADVRARLDVLSEIPRTWRASLMRWARRNRHRKTIVQGQPAPDRNDEYLLHQTLLGAWPLGELDAAALADFRERIQAYLAKALKEAKVHSSWVNPNDAYEEATTRFVERILSGRPRDGFLQDFARLRDFVAFHGMLTSLAQTVLRLTSPGVPDLYQGDELWNFTLVDPDNRRPVDHAGRERLLSDLRARIEAAEAAAEAKLAQASLARVGGGTRTGMATARWPGVAIPARAALAAELLASWTDGQVKLYVIHRSLTERGQHPDVFTTGEYVPLEATGARKDHLIGFARSGDGQVYLTLVPRLIATLTRESMVFPHGRPIWQETSVALPEGVAGDVYENVFTGELVRPIRGAGGPVLLASEVFARFPVAFLRRRG